MPLNKPQFLLFSSSADGYTNVKKLHAWLVELIIKIMFPEEPTTKGDDQPSEFHYAPDGILTLIRIHKGSHTIKCFGKLGKGRIGLLSYTLNAGDSAIFIDYCPEADRDRVWDDPFSETELRSGHKSVAGPEGAEISKWTITLSQLSNLGLDFFGLPQPV